MEAAECEKVKRHFKKRWFGVNLLESLTLTLTSIRMGKIFRLRFVYSFFLLVCLLLLVAFAGAASACAIAKKNDVEQLIDGTFRAHLTYVALGVGSSEHTHTNAHTKQATILKMCGKYYALINIHFRAFPFYLEYILGLEVNAHNKKKTEKTK